MAPRVDPLSSLGVGVPELLGTLVVPLFVTDNAGRVIWANTACEGLFGVETLVGQSIDDVASSVCRQFAESADFVRGASEAMSEGRASRGTMYRSVDGRLYLRAYAPVIVDGATVAHLWRFEDVTEFDRRRVAFERSTQVLEAMVRAHAPAVRRASGKEVFHALLDGLLQLTDSSYGFVGEVHHDAKGQRFLRSWAITDIAWDDATRAFFESAMRDNGYLEFTNLNTLFGVTLRTGEVVVSNDPAHDPRAGGLPPGHPPLVSYLGLPILRNGELIGMAGLAGRAGGYDDEVVAGLQPLLHACGSMIEAYALDRQLQATESALRAALEEAELASQAKTKLLGRVSHELRTPLNAVLGFAQLLGLEVKDPKVQRWVAQIRTAGEHVLGQVDELLDLAAAESGRLAVDLDPVMVDAMVRGVVEMVAPLATEKSVTLHTPETGAVVMADETRLRVVLLNLVSNAIKYNHPGGMVEVAVREVDGDVAIDVSDDGPGMPAADFERAFVMFERLDESGRNIPGAGLGLAIAREYAAAMGGELRGRPREGGGVVMSVVLPPAAATPVGTSPLDHVLYVEDNELNAELVREYLHAAEGLTVEIAPTLADGRAAVAARPPAVLLLDLNLPDGSGGDLARELISAGSAVPIVLLTADTFAAKDLAAELPELVGALVKPIDFAELSGLISRYTRSGR